MIDNIKTLSNMSYELNRKARLTLSPIERQEFSAMSDYIDTLIISEYNNPRWKTLYQKLPKVS